MQSNATGVLVLADKTFASGKAGYFGQAKITIGGQRYQAQAQLVAIADKSEQEGQVKPGGE